MSDNDSSSDDENTRALTTDELAKVPIFLRENVVFDLNNNHFEAFLTNNPLVTTDLDSPWIIVAEQRPLEIRDLEGHFRNITRIEKLDLINLKGVFQGKKVQWSNRSRLWQYYNRAPVDFPDLEPTDDPEEAEVSGLLENVSQRIENLAQRLSRPQTPVTVPGGLPETPEPPVLSSYPSPRATVSPSPLV
jgi:hypothetical protein